MSSRERQRSVGVQGIEGEQILLFYARREHHRPVGVQGQWRTHQPAVRDGGAGQAVHEVEPS